MKKKKKSQVPRSTLRDRIGKRGGKKESLFGGDNAEGRFLQLGSLPGQLLKTTNEHFFEKSVAAILVVIFLGLFSLLNFSPTNRLIDVIHHITVYQMNPQDLAGQIQPVMQSVRDFNWRRQEQPEPQPPNSQAGPEEKMGAPVNGVLISAFGPRQSVLGEGTEMHYGIDVAAEAGSPVYAAFSGVVSLVQEHPLYGLTIYIKHGEELVTVYGRCDSPLVSIGDQVVRGQQIAKVPGSAGETHIHFEVWKDGEPVDPQDFLAEAH